MLIFVHTVWASTSSYQAATAVHAEANKSFNLGRLSFHVTQSGVDEHESTLHVALDGSSETMMKIRSASKGEL